MSSTPYFVIDTMAPQVRSSPLELFGMTLSVANLTGGQQQQTARLIGEGDALKYPPVFAGINLISGDISTMPWETKRHTEDSSGRRIIQDASDHSTRNLLLRRTGDDEFTANVFIEALVARALFYGLGAARIFRGGPLHRPTRLELIRRPVRAVDRLLTGRKYRFYEFTDEDGVFWQLRPEELLILNGPTLDAFQGMGIYDYARKVIGRALAASNYTDEFFTGGAVPQGWFVHPSAMSDAARNRFIADIETKHRTRRGFGILEEDMKWISSGINPNDAMLVSMLEFSGADICRLLKLPPAKLGIETSSGAKAAKSFEQEQKNYFASCLAYWIRRLEAEANDKLFREDEKETYFTAFDSKPFLRSAASLKERTDAEQTEIMSGKRTLNEIRIADNLNPYDDPAADKPLLPLNMTTNAANLDAELKGDDTSSDQDESEADDDRAARDRGQQLADMARRDVLRDALVRMANRLSNAMAKTARAAAKGSGNYLEQLEQLATRHRATVIEAIRPPVALLAIERGVDLGQYVNDTADHLFQRAHYVFLDASECDATQLEARVEAAAGELRTAAERIANGFFEKEPDHGTTISA